MVGSIALAALSLPLALVATPAATAQSASSFVHVDKLDLQRFDNRAVVTARVRWNAEGISGHVMTRGDVRLVAVSDRGHTPLLLGKQSFDLTHEQTSPVSITIDKDDALAAMRKGNRIVLTASQHALAIGEALSDRTYVTVAELQPYGTAQPHIGTEDCSSTPIVPGAVLRYCDLTGAFLDDALVSIHDPKSDEGKVPSRSTRLERADLTGATGVGSDFSGASIAGGRINGLDLTGAKLDNLSLAGTEAVELIAPRATSDAKAEDSGGNFYHANLTGADFSNTIFRGVSVERARLDGASLKDAQWEMYGNGANFRGADLTRAKMGASSLDFADLTDAKLTDASFLGPVGMDVQLGWTWLCRTAMPPGSLLDGSRDCRAAVEKDRVPSPTPDQADPYVTIDQDSIVTIPGGSRTVTARVNWDTQAAKFSGYGMIEGDLRLIAVDASSGIPTVIDTQTYDDLSKPVKYAKTITDQALLAAMAAGNRVVLTATQHAPADPAGEKSSRSYVTVDVLQKGPGIGRIGSLDCSRVALTANSAADLNYCDLSGAMLDTARLSGRFMRLADLTGATLQYGELNAIHLDGARLAGLDASGATFNNVWIYDAWGPRLDLSGAFVYGSMLKARNLDGAKFVKAKLSDSPLVSVSLRSAVFSNARFTHEDLAYANLYKAKLDGVDATLLSPSLFLADLTGADMSKSKWMVDEGGENPWLWATLCEVSLPDLDHGISGNRDCPRYPN